MSINKYNINIHRVRRALLLMYIGANYNYDKYEIYQRSAGWNLVSRELDRLSKDTGIKIVIDKYPKTSKITITLLPCSYSKDKSARSTGL